MSSFCRILPSKKEGVEADYERDGMGNRGMRFGRPLSALLVATVLWATLTAVAPFGYWRFGFIAVIGALAAVSYWMPGRFVVHAVGGVLPVVVLIVVRNFVDSHQFFGRLHVHGPSFVMILGGVVVLLGVPAVIGLAVGDWLGRRRLADHAPA